MRPILIAATGDHHFDEGHQFDDCVSVHHWMADEWKARQVDLALSAGDVFERQSKPAERAAVVDWVRHVASSSPLVIVRGNHDVIGDLPVLAKLRTRHDVIVEEAADVHSVHLDDRRVVDVGCMAWPRKAELARIAGLDADAVGQDALRAVLRGFSARFDELADIRPAPRVLLTHAMIRASMTSVGQPLIGCDHELGIEDLVLARAQFVAAGHIHLPQEWRAGDAPVAYTGSPRRTAYGEVEEKSYLLFEFQERAGAWELAGWERVPVPCRQMFLLEDEWGADPESGVAGWIAGLHGLPPVEQIAGALVRLRYNVPADQREAARAGLARYLDDLRRWGAAEIKVEERVKATSKARAPEVAKAQTLDEKLSAFLKARGIEIPPERSLRLAAKLGQVAA